MATQETHKMHDLYNKKSNPCTSLFTIQYPHYRYGLYGGPGVEYKTKMMPCQDAVDYLKMMQYHSSSFRVEHYTIKKGEDVYVGNKDSFKNAAQNIELFNTNPKNLLVDKPPVKQSFFSKITNELSILNFESDGSI